MKFSHNSYDDYGSDTQYWNEINQAVADIYSLDWDVDDYADGLDVASAFVANVDWWDDLDDGMKDDLYRKVVNNWDDKD